MAMGSRTKGQQGTLWVETSALSASPGHPFYERLNTLFDADCFDAMVETACARFYADGLGRPSIPPSVHFRMLFIGFFEGIDSECATAWRTADSMALQAVSDLVLGVLARANLLKGKTLGVDATTLEVSTALRSIVRRNTGEGYQEFLVRLAQASDIETLTREDLAGIDRNRPGKGSNQDWMHPHDPDARTAKTKGGCTHLVH